MYSDEPARSVSRALISPPVQDSATATVRPAEQRDHLLVDRRAVLGEQRVARGARGSPPRTRRRRAAAAGSNTVAISISPRRRQVVISSRSIGTPSASISRSERAISDSGIAEQAHDPLLVGAGARDSSSAQRRRSPAPSPTSAAARAAAPGARARSARPAAARPARARSRPARARSRRRARAPACGCRARIASSSRLRQRLRSALEDRPDPLLERLVERQRAPGEVRRPPRRSGRRRSVPARRS